MPSPEDFDFDALATEIEVDRKVRFGVLSLELSELCMVMQMQVRNLDQSANDLETMLSDMVAQNGIPPEAQP